MNPSNIQTRRGGFTLMETVIAIGVLAVLLTAFLAVFTPAAQGIRRAISVQEADRLAYALETELVTLRDEGDYDTGFEKAFEWIRDSSEDDNNLIIYQYRGAVGESPRSDGTLPPYRPVGDDPGISGQDFIVQPMVRRRGDNSLADDLEALEGRIYTARLTQLVMDGGELTMGEEGEIEDPMPGDDDPGGPYTNAEDYPEAVIPFVAEFFLLPASSFDYIKERLDQEELEHPVFTRNLAVRR